MIKPIGRSALFAALWAASLAGLSACDQKAAAPQPAPAAPPPPVVSKLGPALPLVDIMRASVQIPADGIWALQSIEKPTDKNWALADQDTADLAAATTLVSMGGNGKPDAAWAAKADYQAWAVELQKTALDLRAAAKAKDLAKFNDLADKMTANCEACHAKYRPETPSDGVLRYPFYPPRVPK